MTTLEKIKHVSDDSLNLVFTIVDSAGDPVDPTVEGLTVEWSARHEKTPSVVISADPGDISVASNVVTVRVPPDSLQLTGNWQHELQLSDATRKWTPGQGRIQVLDDIIP